MSLDPRSRERLEALGRSLPQKLPAPTPAATPAERDRKPAANAGRHRLETEQDPEALFHELINASSDGSVPAHLLERLRELEARRPRERRREPGPGPGPGPAAPVSGAGPASAPPRRPGARTTPAARPGRARLDPEQQALYATFQDLLLDEHAED